MEICNGKVKIVQQVEIKRSSVLDLFKSHQFEELNKIFLDHTNSDVYMVCLPLLLVAFGEAMAVQDFTVLKYCVEKVNQNSYAPIENTMLAMAIHHPLWQNAEFAAIFNGWTIPEFFLNVKK